MEPVIKTIRPVILHLVFRGENLIYRDIRHLLEDELEQPVTHVPDRIKGFIGDDFWSDDEVS